MVKFYIDGLDERELVIISDVVPALRGIELRQGGNGFYLPIDKLVEHDDEGRPFIKTELPTENSIAIESDLGFHPERRG